MCREFYDDIPPMHLYNFVNGMKGYTGHEDTVQGHRDGKSDPGSRFDWDRFIRMLSGQEDDMAELVKEQAEPYVWVVAGNWKRYLHRMVDARALGISGEVKEVPAGTLRGLGRADQGQW